MIMATRFNPDQMPRLGRPGFTLLEMLMVVAIISMIAILVVPSGRMDERLRLDAAAAVLLSDIELAQVMSIANPKEPVVVSFDPEKNAYWLAHAESPDEPILRAGTNQPYRIVMGEGRAVSASGVSVHLDDVADDTLVFGPHGGLDDITAQPRIRLRWGESGSKYETLLTIAPTTGTITVTQTLISN